MALNAEIGGRRHTVKPRGHIELAATRDDAAEMFDCVLFALATIVVIGVWSGLSGGLPYGAGWALVALAMIAGAVAVPSRIVLHRLRTDTAAWSVEPVLAERSRPAPGQWSDVLTVRRRTVRILAALGVSWIVGAAAVSLGAGTPIQFVGILLIAPGSLAISFATLVFALSAIAHLFAQIARPLVDSAERRST